MLNKPGLFFLNNKNVYYIGYYLPVGPFISFNFNQGNYKEVFENLENHLQFFLEFQNSNKFLEIHY